MWLMCMLHLGVLLAETKLLSIEEIPNFYNKMAFKDHKKPVTHTHTSEHTTALHQCSNVVYPPPPAPHLLSAWSDAHSIVHQSIHQSILSRVHTYLDNLSYSILQPL